MNNDPTCNSAPNEPTRTRTLDNNTVASEPGNVRLSDDKLRSLCPELYGWRGILHSLVWLLVYHAHVRTRIHEHLMEGDSRAALVLATEPLLIAAYTDELDCVALLRFPNEFVPQHSLEAGTRLLTINVYRPLRPLGTAKDLTLGASSYGRYGNFEPLIAEFLSDDRERIEWRKSEIAESEWKRAALLGEQYVARHGQQARDGRPLRSHRAARIGAPK